MEGPLAVLVSTSSATAGCTQCYLMNRDHSEMVKFKGRDDEPYRALVQCLRNLQAAIQPTTKKMSANEIPGGKMAEMSQKTNLLIPCNNPKIHSSPLPCPTIENI